MKISPRIHKGPRGFGTSRPRNPLMHSDLPSIVTWKERNCFDEEWEFPRRPTFSEKKAQLVRQKRGDTTKPNISENGKIIALLCAEKWEHPKTSDFSGRKWKYCNQCFSSLISADTSIKVKVKLLFQCKGDRESEADVKVTLRFLAQGTGLIVIRETNSSLQPLVMTLKWWHSIGYRNHST